MKESEGYGQIKEHLSKRNHQRKRGVLAEMEKLNFFLLLQEIKIMQAREGRREGMRPGNCELS